MNSIIKNIRFVTTNQLGTSIARFLSNNRMAQKFTMMLNMKDSSQPSMMIKPFISWLGIKSSVLCKTKHTINKILQIKANLLRNKSFLIKIFVQNSINLRIA